jgi:ribosomal protein S18 acetylase RimI-like enzyme
MRPTSLDHPVSPSLSPRSVDPPRVRQATAEEVDAIKAVLDGERSVFGFVPRAAVEGARHQGTLLVALQQDGGPVIDFARYHHRRDAITTLYEIAVLAAHRRQGIGRALIDAVLDQARHRGQRRVGLKCPQNLPANDFYRHLGFGLRGREPGKRTPILLWDREIGGEYAGFLVQDR